MSLASAASASRFPFLKSALSALLAASIAIGAATGSAVAASSKYAAVVIDANTGKTLFASSATSPRYPASLTKMMTLYLIFEGMKSGKIKKTTKIPFSAQASAKPPTKLGVKAGSSVTVETIILSLVTKSANDSAAAIAEYLGGSEEGFARIMTAKARKLGMTGTVFRNASGLPNTSQHSTARDMAMLGIALREHFPQYYGYFSTRSFAYGRHRMANHNRLLGRVKGVDGIKTGYTRASGFNLVSSVKVGDRSIVAVVMGGQTGRARDNHMADLIRKYLPKASTRDGGALIARAAPSEIAPGDGPASAFAAAALPKRNAPMPDLRPEEEEVTIVETKSAPVMQAYADPTPRPSQEIDPVSTASTEDAGVPSGWAVQVGSSPNKSEAKGFLAKTSKVAPQVLASAAAYTVTFEKDGTTYHRARFGGFGSQKAAVNACSALKKKKIDCYAVQQ